MNERKAYLSGVKWFSGQNATALTMWEDMESCAREAASRFEGEARIKFLEGAFIAHNFGVEFARTRATRA